MPTNPTPSPDQQLTPDPFLNFKLDRWGPIILLLALLVMIAISWGKWVEILVDFGLQVYAPWQLSEGQVLYKDIIYIHGPLSAYIHSFVFMVFGPGISVLAWFNIGLIIILTVIIHHLFRNLFDPLTGFLAALSFIVVFAFGNYLQIANYNFVCAYEYTLPHGVFLSFVAIYLFVNYLRNPRLRTLFWIGFLSGLILLTKPEAFLAEITAIGTGLLLALQFHETSLKSGLHKVLIFFAAFFIPSLVFVLYFSFHMPIEQALESPFNHLIYVFNSKAKSLPFYKAVTGTGFFWESLSYMFVILGGYLFIYTVLTFLNKGIVGRYGNARTPYWICFSGFLTLLIIFKDTILWMDLVRPLPLILIAYMGAFIYRWFYCSQTPQDKSRQISVFVLSLFSLVLLLKIFLYVHVQHYGFALALPGFLIFVALLIHELPRIFKKFQGSALVPSMLGLAFLLAHTGMMGWLSFKMYQIKDFPIGKGRDRIYDFSPYRMGTPSNPHVRGILFKYALEIIDQELGPEEEFVAFPTGTMLNYMSRRKSPIITGIFNPYVLFLTGEGPVLNSLKENTPDYIVLVDQDFAHLGGRFFGRDYARAIFEWIVQNYKVAQQIGARPFADQGFGIQILKRKSLPSDQ
ncbi:MAG: glycosyltransferase family 39 protein [Nitrospinaceae bacterium]